MPAKAILKKGEGFSGLAANERASLRKFSIAYVLLQALPFFLIALIAIAAGTRHGYLSAQTGLLLLLGSLVAFYVLMHGMSQKVIDGIMALRSTRAAKNVWKKGFLNGR